MLWSALDSSSKTLRIASDIVTLLSGSDQIILLKNETFERQKELMKIKKQILKLII